MIRYNPSEWQTIHEAYGILLEGRYDIYDWSYKPASKVITHIRVNGREFELGNAHFILAEKEEGMINMEDDKGILCYFFSKADEMNDYDWERFWTRSYTSPLWRSQALNWNQREIQDKANREAAEKRKAEREAAIEELQKYADKKKLRLIIEYDTVYFIKIDKKKHKDADAASDELVLMFAREYPGNGVEIVEERKVI